MNSDLILSQLFVMPDKFCLKARDNAKESPLQRSLKPGELGRSWSEVRRLFGSAGARLFYTDSDDWNYTLERRIVEKALATPAGEDFATVDVGCGIGRAIEELHNILIKREDIRAAIKSIGIDINQLRTAESDSGLTLIEADSQHLPLADNSVDVGFSCANLMYLEDSLRALEEGYRVLKPGGEFYWLLSNPRDISVSPGIREILNNTPGALHSPGNNQPPTFAYVDWVDDDFSVLGCFKRDGDTFEGFPYEVRFQLPRLLSRILPGPSRHYKRTVYKRRP